MGDRDGRPGETPERHRRDTGKGDRGCLRRRNGEGRTRRGHWETSQRTLDRGELLGNLAEDTGQRRTAGKYRRGPWTVENCRKVPQRALQGILEAHLEPT